MHRTQLHLIVTQTARILPDLGVVQGECLDHIEEHPLAETVVDLEQLNLRERARNIAADVLFHR